MQATGWGYFCQSIHLFWRRGQPALCRSRCTKASDCLFLYPLNIHALYLRLFCCAWCSIMAIRSPTIKPYKYMLCVLIGVIGATAMMEWKLDTNESVLAAGFSVDCCPLILLHTLAFFVNFGTFLPRISTCIHACLTIALSFVGVRQSLGLNNNTCRSLRRST